MRLSIIVNGMTHMVDSTDPELIGRWVAEIFARITAGGITPATIIQVQAYPSWLPSQDPAGGKADWIADSRIIGRTFTVMSPRDLVAGLAAHLDEAEGEAGGSVD